MRNLIVVLALAPVALAGCGGGATTTETTAATVPAKIYFYRDSALVPVTVELPSAGARADAALAALLAGPPGGYETALPEKAKLEDVTIADRVATARFAGLRDPTRSAQAQVVYTLTQFPDVREVEIEAEGGPVTLTDGSGKAVEPAVRADYVDLTRDALIFVEQPERDSTVASPVHARGTAVAFEATLAVEIWSGGRLVRSQTITASTGGPERGTWSATLAIPPGAAKLEFYEPSAKDGSHLHTTEVFLQVSS